MEYHSNGIRDDLYPSPGQRQLFKTLIARIPRGTSLRCSLIVFLFWETIRGAARTERGTGWGLFVVRDGRPGGEAARQAASVCDLENGDS